MRVRVVTPFVTVSSTLRLPHSPGGGLRYHGDCSVPVRCCCYPILLIRIRLTFPSYLTFYTPPPDYTPGVTLPHDHIYSFADTYVVVTIPRRCPVVRFLVYHVVTVFIYTLLLRCPTLHFILPHVVVRCYIPLPRCCLLISTCVVPIPGDYPPVVICCYVGVEILDPRPSV